MLVCPNVSLITHTEIIRESMDAASFRCTSVLCLGLGSPSSSRDARAQLAFLLTLCEDLRIVRLPARARSLP